MTSADKIESSANYDYRQLKEGPYFNPEIFFYKKNLFVFFV